MYSTLPILVSGLSAVLLLCAGMLAGLLLAVFGLRILCCSRTSAALCFAAGLLAGLWQPHCGAGQARPWAILCNQCILMYSTLPILVSGLSATLLLCAGMLAGLLFTVCLLIMGCLLYASLYAGLLASLWQRSCGTGQARPWAGERGSSMEAAGARLRAAHPAAGAAVCSGGCMVL
jgi:hypothetical protein